MTITQGDPVEEGWIPSAHGAAGQPIQRRVARGLTWTIVDIWGRQLLNLLVFVVLANLLLPTDFGLVALAAVFVAFAQLFVDQGLGAALVQRKDLTRSHIDTAFWVTVAMGLVLFALGLALAIPISVALGQPALAPILGVLALTFPLTSLSTIQQNLMRRELAFRRLAIRSVAAALAGGVVGIAMAYMGYGPWALVGQQLAIAGASVATMWWVVPWRPSRRFSRSQFSELWHFGINVVGSDAVAFFSRNTDNLLIGVVLGTGPLGLYAVGYRVLDTSQALLINIARKIAFPALAALQADRERVVRAYFRASRVASALILPAYVGLAMIAPDLMIVAFGRQWTDSGPVAAVLFLIGPVLTLQAFSHNLFLAAGRADIGFRFRLLTMIVTVGSFVVSVQYGILAVAAAFVISNYLMLPLNLYWQRRYAGIPTLAYLSQLRGITLATVVMAGAVYGTHLVLFGSVHLALLLLLEVVVGGLAYGVALWLLDRKVVSEGFRFATQALPGGERFQRRLLRQMGRADTPALDVPLAKEQDTTSLVG